MVTVIDLTHVAVREGTKYLLTVMDWFSLIGQVVTKDKNGADESSDTSNDKPQEEFIPPEGNLTNGEIAVLLSVLSVLSLQLDVLHARTPDSSLQSSKTSARRLRDIIDKTKSELEESGTFEFLIETVKRELTMRWEDARVKKDIAECDRRIRQLVLQIRSNDKVKMKEINKKQEIIASLKDEIQNLVARSESKMRTVDRWENAQQGQNLMRCENAEMKLKWQLESLTNRYNNEVIVNEKICDFLCAQTEELEEDLRNWKEKYETEMKRRGEKISLLERKANEQRFRLEELKQLFNDRQQDIVNYLEFKEERRAEEERNRFINECATKIQAWWRGTMVRRGLGPYRKRKKFGKDKKKKDKK